MTEANREPFKSSSRLDLTVEELVEAMNDPVVAERIMHERGWEKKDLVARADLLTKELAAGISAMNMV